MGSKKTVTTMPLSGISRFNELDPIRRLSRKAYDLRDIDIDEVAMTLAEHSW